MKKEEILQNQKFGKFAEDVAMEYYLKKGYSILERNFISGRSEVDLIVMQEDIIVFVEVKARKKDSGDPIEAVTMDKRRRMARAADRYLKMQQGECEYRFDIFALTGDCNEYIFEVVEDAFLAPLS